MKKLIYLLPFVLFACGESKKEKQKRLSDQLNHNLDSIKLAGEKQVNAYNEQIIQKLKEEKK